MADDNRPIQYMRYAVGEIVLVVIGILIALQINNWNEERKSKHVESITLTEINKNIEANIHNLDSLATRLERRIRSINIVLKAFEYNKPYHDSLSNYFAWAMVYDKMPINDGAYESFQATGSQVINDDELRFEISNYFDYHLGELENHLQELRDDFYNYMLGYLREYFKTFVGADQIAIPKDYEALKQNETFSLSLGVFLDLQRDALSITVETRKESVELRNKINSRLNELDSK